MLPKEVTQFIGASSGTIVFEVEKGAIKKFADAVADLNPLYWDEEYARNSRYSSLIAPPGFFGWPVHLAKGQTFLSSAKQEGTEAEKKGELTFELAKAGYPRNLDGGIEYDFFAPIRAGDILSVSSRIKDITEKKGTSGTLIFVTTETTYINQNGVSVARARSTAIFR
jgi:acyl dehydratase